LLEAHNVDLEVYLDNFNEDSFSWELTESFINYLFTHQLQINECVKSAQKVFNSLIREVWKRGFSENELSNIYFEPCGIEFLGRKEYSNSMFDFYYDIHFNPIDSSNTYTDLGVIDWLASFIDNQLIGVKRDI
jgi:hypothetical protein